MEQLLKKLGQFHWVWFWSGNWPLLDCITERDALLEEKFHHVAGIHRQREWFRG